EPRLFDTMPSCGIPRCSIAKTSAAHDRLVQKIAFTAIVDQADNCGARPGLGSWLRKAHFLIGSPGTVRLATGVGRLFPTEKSLIAVSPARGHKPARRRSWLWHPMRSGSQRTPRHRPSKVSRL